MTLSSPAKKKTESGIINTRKQISEAATGRVYQVHLDLIKPNPEQPRKIFDEEALKRTAGSLNGDVEDPIRVVPRNGRSGLFFLIVDGERRWRAAKKAKIEAISCLVCRKMTDNQVYLSSVKANCDREAFNPIEEAGIVADLQKRFGWNQTEVAKELGKSQGYISNVLKYLKLCAELRSSLMKGEIDKAVALNLASYPSEKQVALHSKFFQETQGKKLEPRDIPRVMKKAAQGMGILPAPTKRGKKHKTHPDLVVSNLERAISGACKALDEFEALSDKEIVGQKTCHIIDLITVVGNCHKRFGVVAERIGGLD